MGDREFLGEGSVLSLPRTLARQGEAQRERKRHRHTHERRRHAARTERRNRIVLAMFPLLPPPLLGKEMIAEGVMRRRAQGEKGVRLGCSRCSSSDLSRCIHALVTTTATATLLNCYSYAGLLTFRKIHLSPPPAYPDRNLIVEWRNNQSRTSTQSHITSVTLSSPLVAGSSSSKRNYHQRTILNQS